MSINNIGISRLTLNLHILIKNRLIPERTVIY